MDYGNYGYGGYEHKIGSLFQPKCEQPCHQTTILTVLWILWLIVFNLNFIAYFNDYSRY